MIRMNSIIEAIKIFANTNPEKLCIADENMQLTYRDYFRLIRKIAFCFKQMDICEKCKVIVEAIEGVKLIVKEFTE